MSGNMEIKLRRAGTIYVIDVIGEMDLYNAFKLKDVVRKMIEKKIRQYVINLDQVPYIDSSGIGALLQVFAELKKNGLRLEDHGGEGLGAQGDRADQAGPILPHRGRTGPGHPAAESQRLRGNHVGHQEHPVERDSPLFQKKGMFHKKFASDFRQISYYTLVVVQKAPPEIKEINLLEQQISELIKNAVKHGNKRDPQQDRGGVVQFHPTTAPA